MTAPGRVIVMGQARSGTTLLANVLNSQQGCTVLNERVLAPLQALAFRGLRFTTPLEQRRRSAELGSLQQELGAVSEAFPISERDFSTLEELFTRALELHASPDDRIIGTKLCGMEQILPELLGAADLRCVYLVRDPRDVMLSRWRRGDPAFDHPIRDWKLGLRRALALRDHPRLLMLRYEQLIAEPEAILQRVARFLGLHPAALATDALQDARGRRWIHNSAFDDVQQLFDPRPVGRWRSHLGVVAVQYAAWACKGELAQLGYDPTPAGSLSARDQLALAARQLAFWVVRASAKVSSILKRRLLPPQA